MMLEPSALHFCAVHASLMGRMLETQVLSAAALPVDPSAILLCTSVLGLLTLRHFLAQCKHCQIPAGSSSNLAS